MVNALVGADRHRLLAGFDVDRVDPACHQHGTETSGEDPDRVLRTDRPGEGIPQNALAVTGLEQAPDRKAPSRLVGIELLGRHAGGPQRLELGPFRPHPECSLPAEQLAPEPFLPAQPAAPRLDGELNQLGLAMQVAELARASGGLPVTGTTAVQAGHLDAALVKAGGGREPDDPSPDHADLARGVALRYCRPRGFHARIDIVSAPHAGPGVD